MQTVKAENKTKYVVAHDGNGLVHFAILQPVQEFSTGLPYIREHESEAELEASVDELKGIQGYYKAHKYGERYLLARINERYSKPVLDFQDGEELENVPFSVENYNLYRYDHNIEAWVEGKIDEDGNWQLKQ